jgi:hypothetical protein
MVFLRAMRYIGSDGWSKDGIMRVLAVLGWMAAFALMARAIAVPLGYDH